MKTNLTTFLLSLLSAALFAGTAQAQSPRPAPTPSCPSVTVSSPDDVTAGRPLTFTTNVGGGDARVTPTYNWTVSAGLISSGQGTSVISVDTAGLENQTVTATVDVGGYDRMCSASASSTTSVGKKVDPRKFDEYARLAAPAAEKRLDAFALELKSDAGLTGYIIAYGGRRSSPDEAQQMADAAGEYLGNKHGLKDGRILVGVGGYREEPGFELWLAPPGAAPPMATPTVDPSEVVPAKKSNPSTPTKKPGKKQSR